MKKNNTGFTLVELIIVISIMAILVAVVYPSLISKIEQAKKARVEKEADSIWEAATYAYADVSSRGEEPMGDVITHITAKSSPFYKNGTKYANLTNWTVLNGTVAGASNAPLAVEIFDTLGISYGKGWKTRGSSIPISESEPKLNQAGSMNDKAIFQIFYADDGNMIVEYSRNGYFVRMDNTGILESVKIKNASEKHFTAWQK